MALSAVVRYERAVPAVWAECAMRALATTPLVTFLAGLQRRAQRIHVRRLYADLLQHPGRVGLAGRFDDLGQHQRGEHAVDMASNPRRASASVRTCHNTLHLSTTRAVSGFQAQVELCFTGMELLTTGTNPRRHPYLRESGQSLV